MAEFVPLDVDQGADFSAQVVWTDAYDVPLNIVEPAQLDIRTPDGGLVLRLHTDDVPPGDEIPPLIVSSTMGLIQIHIRDQVTSVLSPGSYVYDLFVNVDDGDEYASTQRYKLIEGPCLVHARTTVMT